MPRPDLHVTDLVILPEGIQKKGYFLLLVAFAGCDYIRVDSGDRYKLEEEFDPQKTYEVDIDQRRESAVNHTGAQFVLNPNVDGIILRAFYPINCIGYRYSHQQRDRMVIKFENFLKEREIPFKRTKEPKYDY